MTDPPRVLLVGPYEGRSWISITNYTRAVAAAVAESVAVARGQAAWWAPPGAALRRRGRPALQLPNGPFDLVHLADQGLGHHVRSFEGVRTVVTCHDVMPFFVPGFYAGLRDRLVGRPLLRAPIRGMLQATTIVAVSETTKRDLGRIFGVDPGRVAVAGVPIEEDLAPVPRAGAERALAAAGIALPPGPRVMSIGDAAPYKNLELLLRALAEPSLAGARLVRAGALLTRRQRRLIASLGIEGRVVELGHLGREAVVNLYSACDLLAQPSRYEGFGMPVAEAMACGTPVVCSDGGALAEVAGEAGLVVALNPRAPASDPAVVRAFTGAMARVLEDAAERERLRALGREHVRRYRPEAVGRELLAVYAEAMGAGRAGSARTRESGPSVAPRDAPG